MPIYHSSTTPTARARKKLIAWQYDSTPNLSGEYDLDVQVNTETAGGTISVDAIETIELVTNSSSPVADITRTLPAASGLSGFIVLVKKVDSSTGAVIVDGNSSETIDGSLTWTLSNQYQYVRLLCDGVGWNVIGNN